MRPSEAVRLLALPLLPLLLAAPSWPQDADVPAEDGDENAEEESSWDVDAPPGDAREVPLDVTSGTWLSLDVSPDGTEIVFDLLGDLYTLPIDGGDATELTSGISWDMQPRYSPDGTEIAFTSDRAGGDNVWVVKRDGSEPRQITDESFRLLNSPAWTPDGRAIAARKHFTSRRSLGAGEIWLYHRAGKDSGAGGLQMTEKPNQQKDLGEPAFSPDGRYLYVSYDATPGDTFQYSKDSTGGIYAIDRFDRETGEQRTIVSGPGGACRPTPSPDGETLAFVRRRDFESWLYLMDLESGRTQALWGPLERDMQETWAVHGVYPSMAWTPDGASIVLYAKGGLWRVDAASGDATEIPFRVRSKREIREPVRFPTPIAQESDFEVKVLRHVTVKPDESKVVYQALGKLWSRDLPDGEPTAALPMQDESQYYPAYSRDGSRFAWVTFDDEALGAVWVIDVATAELTRLTDEPGHYVNPVFSPDGEHVVYEKVSGGYIVSPLYSVETGIYRVAADGSGEPERITRDGSDPQFADDPDLLFVSRYEYQPANDRRTLVSIRMSDTGPHRETVHYVSHDAVEWAVSPDGKWLAFSERYKAYVTPLVLSGREVMVSPSTTSMPLTRVSADAGENLQFSGDSSKLYWSLGPELFERDLTEAFAFLEGAPEELPEPVAEGRNVSFRAPWARPEGGYALTGARLITMRGDEVIENGVVLVDGDRIQSFGRMDEIALEPGFPAIDCSGMTIVPGLVDAHAHGGQAVNGMHPENNWQAHANLAFGVTTIHDPSHGTNDIFSASELQKAGLILAPRTYSTGTILYGAQGSFKAEVDSLDDALAHLRRLKAVGAFSVKSYNQPRRDQRQQVLEAARQLEMLVVPEGGSLFQHNMTMVVDGHTGIEHNLPVETIYDDVVQLWGATPVGYTPTHVVCYGGIWGENYWYQHLQVWKHERLMRFAPRSVVEPRARRRMKAPDTDYNHLRATRIAKELVDAGGRAVTGAHGQLAGYAAHWELWMLEQGGLTAHEALRGATLHGAEHLGLDGDIGSIEVGKLADLVVLEKNPLENLRDSEHVRYTILGGRVLDASTMAEIDPATGERGPEPEYFWEDLQGEIGPAPTGATCACGI